MIRAFLLMQLALLSVTVDSLSADTLIRVSDDTGAAVDQFEAMYHTADQGYSHWEPARAGVCRLDVTANEGTPVDVLVRAEGYATAITRILGKKRGAARDDEEMRVTLARGRVVKLRLDVPEGMKLADDFVPEAYAPQFASRVRMMWQPENKRSHRPFNFLNLRPEGKGAFALCLPDEASPFFISIDHPGQLRFCELGPFTHKDVVNGVLAVKLPRPAPIHVKFETGDVAPDALPFDKVTCDVLWKIPDGSTGSYYSANEGRAALLNGAYRIDDLAPGEYLVQLATSPKAKANAQREEGDDDGGSRPDPGRFRDQRTAKTVAGEPATIDFKYVRFSETAYKGDGNALITITRPDGKPASGKRAKIRWYDSHYGTHRVFDGVVPEDGVIKLTGVSVEARADTRLGPYSVDVDGDTIAWFRLQRTTEIQKFTFGLTPAVGDAAPDFGFVDLKTGRSHRLAELKGKIVLVEFWATWCGPCQSAMEKLVKTHAERRDDWKDSVAVVALSTDEGKELPAGHTASRGWDSMPQYWAERGTGDNDDDRRQSKAEQAYKVNGIPEAVLIDAQGKIAWRGHPMEKKDGLDLAARIDALRKQQ